MSRRYLWTSVPVILVLGLYLGVRQYRKAGRVELPPLAQSVAHQLGPETLRSVLSEPYPSSALAMPEAPRACVEGIQKILSTANDEVASQFHEGSSKLVEACAPRLSGPKLSGPVASQWMLTQKACRSEKNEICLSSALTLRAMLFDSISVDLRNFDDMAVHVLTAKLWAQTLRLKLDSDPWPYSELIRAIDSLKNKRPDWPAGQLLIVVALALRLQHEGEADLQASIGERLSKELDLARNLQPNHPIPQQIELARSFWGGEETWGEVETLAQRRGGAGMALYYFAAVQCRRGELDACKESLNGARRMNPHEPLFQRTQAELQSGKTATSDDGAFDLEIHFDPWQN